MGLTVSRTKCGRTELAKVMLNLAPGGIWSAAHIGMASACQSCWTQDWKRDRATEAVEESRWIV